MGELWAFWVEIPLSSREPSASSHNDCPFACYPLRLLDCRTTSIDWGRTPYEAIQNTAEQQTLLNIVRVANSETPFFMDVSEVDAATTVGASISGGPSGLGATPNFKSTSAGTIEGPVGFITGSATYLEAPTVRYLPLLGQPLIAQVTPPERGRLDGRFNSNWSLAAVLTFGIDRLTPWLPGLRRRCERYNRS